MRPSLQGKGGAALVEVKRVDVQELVSRYQAGERDFSGACLRGVELPDIDLRGAKLSGADLHGTNLSRADLSETDLSRADLSESTLSEADLYEANLSEATLEGATVAVSQLSEAASLRNAILPDGSKARSTRRLR
jgi:uncharacterized protein YjbI with pentapeptide repeats